MVTARALLTGGGRAACGDRLLRPGETTDGDADHRPTLRARGRAWHTLGEKSTSHTTAA